MGEHFTDRDEAQKLDEPSRQDRAHQARRLGARTTIRSSAATTPSRKSGATAIAMRRARRSIPTTGKLWEHEHGAKGGDEVNIPQAGKNYGWPVIGYGVNYDGTPVGSGKAEMPGMEQPIKYWVPSIAPSGMAFYHGDAVSGVEGQPVRRRARRPDAGAADARRREGHRRGAAAAGHCASASATCASGPTARSISPPTTAPAASCASSPAK